MSLSVSDAFREGVERFATPVGGVILVGLLASQVASTIVIDSRLPVMAPAINEMTGQQILDATPGPLAVDVPEIALTFLSLLAAILTAGVVALGFRAFTGERPGRLAADAWNGLAWATLNVFVAQIVVGILFLLGLTLIVPALIVALAFAFVPALIAVDGQNVFRAMLESWRTSRGERLRVLAVLLGIGVVGLSVNLVGTSVALVLLGEGIVVDLVSLAVGSAVVVYAMATIASTFDQLRTVDERFADIDDDLLP